MNRVALLLPLAWRNLWRNPRRTVITLAVVAVGMWSILIFDVLFAAVETSSRDQALRVMTGEGQIHASRYMDDPNVAYSFVPGTAMLAVLNSPQVSSWAARVRVPAILQSEYETRPVTLAGASPEQERKISVLPSSLAAGRYLAGDDDSGIVIGRDLLKRLKTRLGKRVVLMTQASDGHLAQSGFVIIGVYGSTTPVEDEFVFTGRHAAQELLGMGNRISEISFDANAGTRLDTLVAALRTAALANDAHQDNTTHGQPSGAHPSLVIEPWTQFSPIAAAIENVSSTYTAVWLAVMFVLMAIGIVNTQLMAVFERTREFGLLMALGMRPGTVILQVAIESALLVAIGVVLGVAATASTLAPFGDGIDLNFVASGVDRYGLGRILYPKLDPSTAVVPGMIVWALGIAATLWPARRAARTAPVIAMTQF